MDRKLAKEISNEINAALKALAARHEMEFVTLRFSVSEPLGKIIESFEFLEKFVNGRARNWVDFDRLCQIYDLKKEHFGAEISLDGETWSVVGIDPGMSPCPIRVLNNESGREAFINEFNPSLQRLRGFAPALLPVTPAVTA